MHRHEERRVLAHTVEQMFDLVADVEKYPEFLPWCVGLRVVSRDETSLSADLLIGYKVIREKFASKVMFTRPTHIEVSYIAGPLKHLHNTWDFIDNGNGTSTLNFVIEFAFRSALFERMIGGFFDEIVHRMVAAFVTRADEVYGLEQRLHKL